MATTTYDVTGMSCGHCEGVVSAHVSQIPGVTQVEISAATGRLVVKAADPVDDAAVLAAVSAAGYQAIRSSAGQSETTPTDAKSVGGCGCCGSPQA